MDASAELSPALNPGVCISLQDWHLSRGAFISTGAHGAGQACPVGKGGLQRPEDDSSRGSLRALAARGCGPRILDTRPSDHHGGAPDGQSVPSPHPCSGWCRARGSRMRLDRASPREHRPPRNRVPQVPGNDRAPPGLPVVAAAGAVAAAVVLEVGRGPPGSASLPLPGRPGQRRRRRRLLLPLLPAPPRLMPRPGRQSPGACSLMPHRSPGSHRSLSRARAPVTPTTTGWRRASTGTPGSRHLHPRTPRALGPAGPQILGVFLAPAG